jgi:hypothetical protein
VTRCAALLQRRVCVAIIDLVPKHPFNLYGEMLHLLGHTAGGDECSGQVVACADHDLTTFLAGLTSLDSLRKHQSLRSAVVAETAQGVLEEKPPVGSLSVRMIRGQPDRHRLKERSAAKMRTYCVLVVVLSYLVSPLVGVSARAGEPDQKWESRAVAALAAGDREALGSLAEEFRKLPPEDRGKLPLRIREGEVEFAFHGDFPGDMSPWNILEFVVSGSGKDYESLLVVSETELKRVQELQPFFAKQPREGRGKLWSARLVWVADGKPESACLTDLLAVLEPKERERFRDQVCVSEAGLGGILNVAADSARLPRRRTPALLLLTIQMPVKK